VGSDRTLWGENLDGQQVISADRSLSAASVQVASGAQITFRAGEVVALGDGFSVGPNTAFTVEIAHKPDSRNLR
jgi:hypothetical protein